MPGDNASVLAAAADRVRCELTDGWHVIRTRGPNQVQFWLIALAVGIASGFAALFFRKGIEALQELLYRADDITHLHSWAGSLPWYWVLCIPILGGLLVGLILHVFTPDGRVRSVADVIQGAALNAGRVEGRAGLASAAASRSPCPSARRSTTRLRRSRSPTRSCSKSARSRSSRMGPPSSPPGEATSSA